MKFAPLPAEQIITLGVQNGTIKLRGSSQAGDARQAESEADIDAAYLKRLLSQLQVEASARNER